MDGAYRDLELISPIWALAAHQCARAGSATGLRVPDGVNGRLYCNHCVLADGSVRWKMVHYDNKTGKQTQVAKWITDWMPEEHCEMRAPKPIRTAGRIVTINRGIAGEVERQVRVVIDSLGLPYPVPVEVMR